MNKTSYDSASLAALLWPAGEGIHPVIRGTILAIVGSLLLWASAKIQVPYWPIPMTLQTLVVLVLGMSLGPRLAAATVAVYLFEGAVGLPVFAGTPEKGIGLAYILGPSGGYLVGFLVAASVTGWLGEQGWDRNIITMGLAMLIGSLLIYIPGLAWLSTFFGVEKAFMFGMYPFLLGDATKILLASFAMPLLWKLMNRGE